MLGSRPYFAPHLGNPHSEDLDSEYLNIFETRTRTPFYQDAYVNGVRVMLILGPTGTGKSVHGNQMLSLEQKYGGFTYIFDIGGSYESVVELYGGRVDTQCPITVSFSSPSFLLDVSGNHPRCLYVYYAPRTKRGVPSKKLRVRRNRSKKIMTIGLTETLIVWRNRAPRFQPR